MLTKLFLILLIINQAFMINAQTQLIITNSPSSTIYIGIVNPIKIINKEPKTEYFVKSDDVVILNRNNKYNSRASKPGRGVIKLYKLQGVDTVIVNQLDVIIKQTPNARIALNGKTLDNISKKDFFQSNTLDVTFNIDYTGSNKWFIIKSFRFYANNKEISSSNNLINEDIKNIIKNSKGPIEVRIESVYAIGPDKVTRQFTDARFILK